MLSYLDIPNSDFYISITKGLNNLESLINKSCKGCSKPVYNY